MSGSTLGTLFRVTTFGESHGPAIGCIVDGCPPGMELSEADIQPELDRRRPGTSRHVTQRNEADTVRILSGVFEGRTTGTPICLVIDNTDQRSKDYANLLDTFRPGHADYTYHHKYGLRDPRGGGRASARLTAPAVAAAAIARKWLHGQYGTTFAGHMTQIGEIAIPFEGFEHVARNPFFSANASDIARIEAYVDDLRKAGDSCGARIEVVAAKVPVGLGEPLYDKLDADIAHAMMGINAVKGVEIGAGFAAVMQRGSEHGDELTPDGFASNHAGGVLGGISTGQDITVSIAVKPTSSIRTPRRSIDRAGNATTVETLGRHDPCVGIRATPIAEAMLAAGADGPRAASSRAVRRRAKPDAADRRARRLSAALERPAVTPVEGIGRSVRGRLVRLLRLRRSLQHVRAALVSEPRLFDLRHRRTHVDAKRDAPVQPLRVGLDRRPRWPARAAARHRRGRLARGLAGLLRRRPLRLGRGRDDRALHLHGRRHSDQRGDAGAPRQPRRPGRHRPLRPGSHVGPRWASSPPSAAAASPCSGSASRGSRGS